VRNVLVLIVAALFAISCTPPPPGGRLPTEAADLSEELTRGSGPVIASPNGLVVPDGFVVTEHVAAGVATDYVVDGGQTADGRWTFTPSTTADYRTRILVRRPASPSAASGVVIVEWLNVSAGADADPVFVYLAEEIVRRGHVWVGVSAQLVGVEGGSSLFSAAMGDTPGLVGTDTERYGSLLHPGDGYAFDIYTQVARALGDGSEVLGGIVPRVIVAAGESQSAFALTTYYDGVQPLSGVFDGFFVHSRAAGWLPLARPGMAATLPAALFARVHPIFRDDLAVPVLSLQAEGDLTGYLASVEARQPDSETFRLWEVAGTAHADAHLLGAFAEMVDCPPVNAGPMHVVAKAGFRTLERWIADGSAPPSPERIEIDDSGAMPVITRSADGIALGGIRTPPVDVPIDVLSGENGATNVDCILFGSTVPLPEARLTELYPSVAEYETMFAASLEATIAAGFALEDDRDALAGYADPSRVAP
jgi:hypothetical protein